MMSDDSSAAGSSAASRIQRIAAPQLGALAWNPSFPARKLLSRAGHSLASSGAGAAERLVPPASACSDAASPSLSDSATFARAEWIIFTASPDGSAAEGACPSVLCAKVSCRTRFRNAAARPPNWRSSDVSSTIWAFTVATLNSSGTTGACATSSAAFPHGMGRPGCCSKSAAASAAHKTAPKTGIGTTNDANRANWASPTPRASSFAAGIPWHPNTSTPINGRCLEKL
mmetsp:Transcript_21390/g.59327  ORF Transcript_21390/g.59327 Transcript_21390/m.59327 type:complete len:229 (+) Transcript_21390:469-1155(+)